MRSGRPRPPAHGSARLRESFGTVAHLLARGDVPTASILRDARVFGTLVLSSDHSPSAVASLNPAGPVSMPTGFHVPQSTHESLRVGAPPFGPSSGCASAITRPLALVLGPDAVFLALVTIASASPKALASYLPVVLCERLGINPVRVERAIELGATAHLVLWAGDPGATPREILPSAKKGPVPSWLGPEDRALFIDAQESASAAFDPHASGWADSTRASRGSIVLKQPLLPPPTPTPTPTPSSSLHQAATTLEFPAALEDSAAAAGGPPATITSTPATQHRQHGTKTSPSRSSPHSGRGKAPRRGKLIPASWDVLLSDRVLAHPAVLHFLQGYETSTEHPVLSAASRSDDQVAASAVISLCEPGQRLGRIPQPVTRSGLHGSTSSSRDAIGSTTADCWQETVADAGSAVSPSVDAASEHHATSHEDDEQNNDDDDDDDACSVASSVQSTSRPAIGPSKTAGYVAGVHSASPSHGDATGAVARDAHRANKRGYSSSRRQRLLLAAPFGSSAHIPDTDDSTDTSGDIAVRTVSMGDRVMAALSLPRVQAALEDGNNVSDAFVLREADEEDEKMTAEERKMKAEARRASLAAAKATPAKDHSGLCGICASTSVKRSQPTAGDSKAEQGNMWPCWPTNHAPADSSHDEDPAQDSESKHLPTPTPIVATTASGANIANPGLMEEPDAATVENPSTAKATAPSGVVGGVRCLLRDMPELGTVPGILDGATLERALPSSRDVAAALDARAKAARATSSDSTSPIGDHSSPRSVVVASSKHATASRRDMSAPLYVPAPLFTGLRARQLLYTLAGVPPAHDSAGRVVAGFGHDPQALAAAPSKSRGAYASNGSKIASSGHVSACSVHVYPNLSLVSLPQHLTWVVPAGKISDRDAAEKHMQARLPVQEAMLLRKLRPLTLERVADVGSKGLWEVNVLDELCFFICGNPFQDGDAHD